MEVQGHSSRMGILGIRGKAPCPEAGSSVAFEGLVEVGAKFDTFAYAL